MIDEMFEKLLLLRQNRLPVRLYLLTLLTYVLPIRSGGLTEDIGYQLTKSVYTVSQKSCYV